MTKYLKEIIKPLIIIIFIAIYYYISRYIKLNNSNKMNYIPYYIWSYIWTFVLGIIFSFDYIKSLFNSGKIRINFIFLFLSLCILTMYIPNTPLFSFLLKGDIEFLNLIFWHSVIHTFCKV